MWMGWVLHISSYLNSEPLSPHEAKKFAKKELGVKEFYTKAKENYFVLGWLRNPQGGRFTTKEVIHYTPRSGYARVLHGAFAGMRVKISKVVSGGVLVQSHWP